MTDDAPKTFVLITVGVLPPGMLVSDATDLLGGFSHALNLGPFIRGSAIVVSTDAPEHVLRETAGKVPSPATKLAVPTGPKIVSPH